MTKIIMQPKMQVSNVIVKNKDEIKEEENVNKEE